MRYMIYLKEAVNQKTERRSNPLTPTNEIKDLDGNLGP